jgi:hypothetical protein
MKCPPPPQKGNVLAVRNKTYDNFSSSVEDYMKPNYSNGLTLLVAERKG